MKMRLLCVAFLLLAPFELYETFKQSISAQDCSDGSCGVGGIAPVRNFAARRAAARQNRQASIGTSCAGATATGCSGSVPVSSGCTGSLPTRTRTVIVAQSGCAGNPGVSTLVTAPAPVMAPAVETSLADALVKASQPKRDRVAELVNAVIQVVKLTDSAVTSLVKAVQGEQQQKTTNDLVAAVRAEQASMTLVEAVVRTNQTVVLAKK
jgi:hypothetical protein